MVHTSASIPLKQTVPCTAVARRVSGSVSVPISSMAPETPPGTIARTCSAMRPVSTTTWSAPVPRSRSARSGLRVVAMTVAPCILARTMLASPTVEVPPRISSVSPGRTPTPVVREPCAVCSISGTAPSTAQSRALVNGTTLVAGTSACSA